MEVLRLFLILAFLFGCYDGKPTTNVKTTAKYILSSMDRTVHPCDDFYEYACGQWIRDNPAQDGEASVDHYEKIRNANDQFIKDFMANQTSRAEYYQVRLSAVTKMFDYYDSCMDANRINNASFQPIKSLLSQYSLLVDRNWVEATWDLEYVLTLLLKDLGSRALFEVNVELGMTNNSYHFISLKQPTKFTKQQQSEKARIANMKMVFGALGTATSEKMIKDVLKLESKLIKSALPESNIDYTKMSLSEVACALNSTPIDWISVVQDVVPSASLNDDTIVIMNGMSYFKKLTSIISSTSTRIIANYLMWKTVEELHLAQFHKNQKPIKEPWTTEDRETICIEELSSLKGFALPLTRVFIDKKFKDGDKSWIVRAAERMRNKFISDLDKSTWMDLSTKQKAKAKAKSLKEIIGYPDLVRNNIQLNEEFKSLTVDKTTYLDNFVSLLKMRMAKKYSFVGKFQDVNGWSMSPMAINAQYEDSYNRMVFPVAILQPPFYGGQYPSAVNFGGIGTIIGHELTHGFDDSGKNYDQNGRQQNWWSKDTLKKFNKKAKCLSDKYSTYSFHGQMVDGKSSLSENIADNGGVALAYAAFKAYEKENGADAPLPKSGLTNDKLFFISFAQNWCASFTADGISKEMKSNYSPSPIRVNGSLKNLKEFADAFVCSPGSKMNPGNRCKIW